MNETVALISACIRETEKRLGLDWRFSWSSIEVSPDGEIVVSVSVPAVAEAVRELGGGEAGGPGWRPGNVPVRLLLLGDTPRRLQVTSSVADIRREPTHAAELLTQAIMGEELVPIVERDDWHLVVLQGGYHGWVRSWSVAETTVDLLADWRRRAAMRIAAPVAYVLAEPVAGSLPVADITAGSAVVPVASREGWREVEIPGGKRGFVGEADLEEAPANPPSREGIVARAARFTGIPYLWGGTSAKGFDCSGFVLRVCRLEGIELPRDSDRQAAAVRPISRDRLEDARPADLLFFGEGETVSHVAVYLGGGRFIHAYGDVRVNGLLPEDPLLEAKLAGSLLHAGVLPALDRQAGNAEDTGPRRDPTHRK
ncbi:MAG: C40 family peptidase [Candidatus Krumholzibacteriota bacterium]|nr:C40 family peptidase [Candidatus Krumholzibacteriota bacterium]